MTQNIGLSSPPNRLLLGAGPCNVHPRVLQAMSSSLLGHLDPHFLGVMDDVRSKLRYVFRTENPVTIPISGTGTAGMEAAIVNVIEPGDTFVMAANGYFGQRLADIAKYLRSEYKKITGNGLTLTKDGDTDIMVEYISRVRTSVKAYQCYKISGLGEVISASNEESRDVDSAIKDWLAIGKDKYPGTKKASNVKRKND